jgi:purine-binding chemotaxis protein CheW
MHFRTALVSQTATGTARYLVFHAGDARFGVLLDHVVEVVRSVAADALPGAPAVVTGAIVVRGDVVPLFDLGVRFGQAPQPVRASERFLITRTARRRAAVRADATGWIEELDESQLVEPARVTRGLDRIRGIAQLEDGIVLIQDLDALLDDAESTQLDAALSRHPDGTP